MTLSQQLQHVMYLVAIMVLMPVVLHGAEVPATMPAPEIADPYLWLEDVTGPKAMEWVEAQNAITKKAFEDTPGFKSLQERLLRILNSKEKIPRIEKIGKYLYNFWKDDVHVRGLWRRTTLEEFKKAAPAWESVIDLDELAAKERENWAWGGQTILKPSNDRALVRLSRGGADAVVLREFDLNTKEFVADGFVLPEAKIEVAWHDRDTLYVGTDFGEGSMTAAGYPRIIKEWKRGTPLAEARSVFEGKPEDVEVAVSVDHDRGHVYEIVQRGVTFFTDETFVHRGKEWVKIDKPADAEVMTFSNYLLLRLKTDWSINGRKYRAGTLLAEDFEGYLKGDRNFSELFVPTDRTSLDFISGTKDFIILNTLVNVVSHPQLLRPGKEGWERVPVEAPNMEAMFLDGVDPDESNDYFMTAEGFLTPSTLSLGTAGGNGCEKLKSMPAFFKTESLRVEQYEATSKDGTRVPYFEVSREGVKYDGRAPTLLYGYGGFEIPMTPQYRAEVGAGWLERGGVYVVANIRGGGEFGPEWHNAARKENRQRGYDDFIAVAEDLIRRRVTTPEHLGILGGSNGGLLMGVMLTERPDLFGAVVCMAPLLDMRRYSHLLAGASWVDEYGDPDKAEDWAYLSKYSPYQNVHAGMKYPRTLFMTSTRDDRVHPGHARKMAALMEQNGADVLFYENTEGGHAGAVNNNEVAHNRALAYSFLWNQLR